MIGYFVSDQQSSFYHTAIFTKVLTYVKKNPTTCVMKEKETKVGLRLLLTFIKINTVEKALNTLLTIEK